MNTTTTVPSEYLEFYQYLQVMDAEQILKLRKVATGVLDVSVFSEEERAVLETRQQLQVRSRY